MTEYGQGQPQPPSGTTPQPQVYPQGYQAQPGYPPSYPQAYPQQLAGQPSAPPEPPAPAGHRHRRVLWASAVVLVLLAAAGAAVVVLHKKTSSKSGPATAVRALFADAKTGNTSAEEADYCSQDQAAIKTFAANLPGATTRVTEAGKLTIGKTTMTDATHASVVATATLGGSAPDTSSIPVVKQGGAWKVCFPIPAGLQSPVPTPSSTSPAPSEATPSAPAPSASSSPASGAGSFAPVPISTMLAADGRPECDPTASYWSVDNGTITAHITDPGPNTLAVAVTNTGGSPGATATATVPAQTIGRVLQGLTEGSAASVSSVLVTVTDGSNTETCELQQQS